MQQPGEPEVIAQGWICPGPRSANPPKVVYGVDPVTGERTAIVTATFVKYPILDRLKQMAALRDAHRLALERAAVEALAEPAPEPEPEPVVDTHWFANQPKKKRKTKRCLVESESEDEDEPPPPPPPPPPQPEVAPRPPSPVAGMSVGDTIERKWKNVDVWEAGQIKAIEDTEEGRRFTIFYANGDTETGVREEFVRRPSRPPPAPRAPAASQPPPDASAKKKPKSKKKSAPVVSEYERGSRVPRPIDRARRLVHVGSRAGAASPPTTTGSTTTASCPTRRRKPSTTRTTCGGSPFAPASRETFVRPSTPLIVGALSSRPSTHALLLPRFASSAPRAPPMRAPSDGPIVSSLSVPLLRRAHQVTTPRH